ncbi:MAG: C40 family peptidase [Candidatus Kapaibacterium sp.]
MRKNNLNIKLILILITLVFLQACQPNVRFATKAYRGSKSYKQSSESSKNNTTKQANIDKLDFMTNDEFANLIIDEAEKWLGVPYKYGGETFSGADCSGFVSQVFLKAGIKLPRTSSQQFRYAEQVNFVEKKAGDLIFFKKNGTVNHVGIYIGQGYMIHASTSSGVERQSIHEDYYIKRVAGIGRINPSISQKGK